MSEIKNIVLMYATQSEYFNLVKEIEDYLPMKRTVLMTGVGIGNVIQTINNNLGLFKDDTLIINVGYAGSNVLPVGTKVLITESYLFHPNSAIDTPVYSLVSSTNKLPKYVDMEDVPCYTSSDFVLDAGDVTDPAVFDMELYAIASFGFKNIISLKTVSDNLSAHQYLETTGELVHT